MESLGQGQVKIMGFSFVFWIRAQKNSINIFYLIYIKVVRYTTVVI